VVALTIGYIVSISVGGSLLRTDRN